MLEKDLTCLADEHTALKFKTFVVLLWTKHSTDKSAELLALQQNR